MEFNLQLGRFHIGLQTRHPSGYYQNTQGTHSYSLTYPGYGNREPDWKTIFGVIWGERSDTNMIELFHSIPEIYSAVDAVASRVADAVWLLKKDFKKDANAAIDYDDPFFNKLFSNPNPLFTGKALIYQAVCYEICTGKQYFYANISDSLLFDYKNISSFWSLPADKIKIEHPKKIKLFSSTELTDIVTGYRLDSENFFPPEKVLPLHRTNLKWEDKYLCGRSPLLAADKAIANLIAVYEARNVIYTKRGALGAIVSKKGDASGLIPLTPKEKESVRADMGGTYGVTGNREPVQVTDVPVDYIRFGMSIQELQPFDETKADTEAIYAVLGVPQELMPSKSGVTFENQIQAERKFYNAVIIPTAKRYAEAFTTFFRLADSRRYIDVDFSHVDVLQENKKEKSEVETAYGNIYLQRFTNGICTLNDWVKSTGNDEMALPIYKKKLFEMTPEELAQVSEILKLKAPIPPDETTDTKVKSINNAA